MDLVLPLCLIRNQRWRSVLQVFRAAQGAEISYERISYEAVDAKSLIYYWVIRIGCVRIIVPP